MSFLSSVNSEELGDCRRVEGTPNKVLSPLYISPRVLPGLSFLSPMLVLKGNVFDYSRELLPPGPKGGNACFSPTGQWCEAPFCLDNRYRGRGKNTQKNCPDTQSPWMEHAYFMRKVS